MRLTAVDASQGVEAQVIWPTRYLALHHNSLEIIPVINKIDLPSAEPADAIREQIESLIGLDASGAFLASAKQGIGIADILEAVVALVPAPKGRRPMRLCAP